MKVSVILPVYNERENIRTLSPSLKEAIIRNGHDYEIIIVDDNSRDGTDQVGLELNKNDPKIIYIKRTEERGLATAIKKGIESSIGDVILIMDADHSHPVWRVEGMIKYFPDYDLVVASRYRSEGGFETKLLRYKINKVLSSLLNYGIRFVLWLKITDVTSGFFMFKKELLKNTDNNTIFYGYGDYYFRLLNRLKKAKVKEVPFTHETRIYGTSKTKMLRAGFSYIYEAFKERLR